MEIVFTTLIWAAVLQGVLLGFVFIFSRRHKSFSNTLLGLFLIIFILGAATDLLPFDQIGGYSVSRYFTLPEVKLLFPILFLHYVLVKLQRASSYKLFIRIHYILAFVVIGITIINLAIFVFTGNSIYSYIEFETVNKFFMAHQYYAYLLTVAAVSIAIAETIKYRNMVKNEFSDITLLEINWLWQFVLIFVPVVILWGIELIRILIGGIGQSDIVVVIWGVVSIIIYIVSFKAFTHQDLFYPGAETAEKHVRKVTFEQDNSKFANTICETVKNSMETGQYYLNQDLSIHDFAKEIHVSARTISTCINKNFGYNFNEWVNNYRVEKALEILNDKNNDHLSIEGIGLDSGFKSRSAMYIAFKKKTGKTPGNFRSN
ncbi:helix-turn-helix domain-containing protein [Maribellus sediminis]|uniref:helix-turn-helix domain-containing protein n=1 Tax=Maribellus sediminis TaxID=2696285 RepID=UPI0014321C07|nr:helix-turn-helix domain-containing protein [Maribellus sediminis]